MKPNRNLACGLLLSIWAVMMVQGSSAEVSLEIRAEAEANYRWFEKVGIVNFRGCVPVITDEAPTPLGRFSTRKSPFCFAKTNEANQLVQIELSDLLETRFAPGIFPTVSPVSLESVLGLWATNKQSVYGLRTRINEMLDYDRFRTAPFVFSFGYWQNKDTNSAFELYSLVRSNRVRAALLATGTESLASLQGRLGMEENFREFLAGDIAHVQFGQTILQLRELDVPRSELLKRLEWIQAEFPATEHQHQIQSLITHLRRMITEDQSHRRTVDLKTLPTGEQVRELIFRLRDQTSLYDNQTVRMLVMLGPKVVPDLISELTNETPTRAAGSERNFRFDYRVLTVGDFAAWILDRISEGKINLTALLGCDTRGKPQSAQGSSRRMVEKRVNDWVEHTN